MKHAIPVIWSAILALSLTQSAIGQIDATTESGRKVILHPDSTWEFVEEEVEKDTVAQAQRMEPTIVGKSHCKYDTNGARGYLTYKGSVTNPADA